MKPRRLAIIAALLVMFGTDRALADDAQPPSVTQPLPNPHVRLSEGGELTTPDGQRYYLPLGTHILDGTSWQKLDDEVKRLQEQETRLKAENKSLKGALSSWTPGWGTLIVFTGLALATGTVVYFAN
jgi:hypothetical protein